MDDFDKWYMEQVEGSASMTNEQRWKIADLMEEVTHTDEELDGIRLWFYSEPTFDEAEQLIDELIDRLPDPVTERGRYNQAQLSKHIKNICGL
jgi:hypothetical protein